MSVFQFLIALGVRRNDISASRDINSKWQESKANLFPRGPELFVVERRFISHKTRHDGVLAPPRAHNYERIGKYWGIGPRLSIVRGRLLLSSVLPRHSHRTTLTVVALSEINRVYRQVPRSGQSYYSFDSITSHCNDSYEGKPSALNPIALPFRTLLPATMIFTLDRLNRRLLGGYLARTT